MQPYNCAGAGSGRANITPRPAILSLPDDHYMSAREASAYLTARGLRVAVSTLAFWRSRRPDGPPVRHFGRTPKYQVGELRAWIDNQMEPRGSATRKAA